MALCQPPAGVTGRELIADRRRAQLVRLVPRRAAHGPFTRERYPRLAHCFDTATS